MGQRLTSPSPPRTGRPTPPGERFRREIEAAIAAGATPDDMTLRITLTDGARLRRDPALAVTDLNFSGGVMRFLGVKVEEGGVPASALDIHA